MGPRSKTDPIPLPAHQGAGLDSKVKWSGYFSVIGGGVVSGSMAGNDGPTQIIGRNCPCYMADYSTAAVYGHHAFRIDQETRGGIQAQYRLGAKTTLVGGVDARLSDHSADLSSAYAKYALTDSVDLQAGRQRIPLYYHSNLQDVGVIYPWISPPSELYGWDATYYNGASARWSKDLAGGYRASASALAGAEHVPDASYYKFSYDGSTSVDWTKILGVEA